MVINLKGKADFVWIIDTVKLLRDVASYKGKDYNSVFQNYPAIEKANIARSPSWWKSVPKDPSKIKLNIETEKIVSGNKSAVKMFLFDSIFVSAKIAS